MVLTTMTELNILQEHQLRRSWESVVNSYCESKGLGDIDKAALMVLAELDIDYSLEQSLNPHTRLENVRKAWNGERLVGLDLAFKLMSEDPIYRRNMRREYIKLINKAGHPLQNLY